jgi:hypothetical protein
MLAQAESIYILSDMNKRLSKEKQALVLSALCEGAAIEAVARMFKVGTNTVSYAAHIRGAFGYEGFSYGTETKVFGEPMMPDGTLAAFGRNEGVRKMETVERKAVIGSPDLGSVTTAHIERVFLTVRQELKRFQRKGLGYSKDLATHTAAVALFLGVYKFRSEAYDAGNHASGRGWR